MSPRLWSCPVREEASLLRVGYIALRAITAGVSVSLPPVLLEMPRANHVESITPRQVYEEAAKKGGATFASVIAQNNARITLEINLFAEELAPLPKFFGFPRETS